MHCPYCGTPNWKLDPNVPDTVEALQNFCDKRKIHLHKLHFHLMEDYKQPKAYGLYQNEGGQYIVYKNHASGEREISYSGDSEREAVQHLYGSLCRALRGKERHDSHKSSQKSFEKIKKKERQRVAMKFITYMFIAILIFVVLLMLYAATRSSAEPVEENESVVAIDMAWQADEHPPYDAGDVLLVSGRVSVV